MGKKESNRSDYEQMINAILNEDLDRVSFYLREGYNVETKFRNYSVLDYALDSARESEELGCSANKINKIVDILMANSKELNPFYEF